MKRGFHLLVPNEAHKKEKKKKHDFEHDVTVEVKTPMLAYETCLT